MMPWQFTLIVMDFWLELLKPRSAEIIFFSRLHKEAVKAARRKIKGPL